MFGLMLDGVSELPNLDLPEPLVSLFSEEEQGVAGAEQHHLPLMRQRLTVAAVDVQRPGVGVLHLDEGPDLQAGFAERECLGRVTVIGVEEGRVGVERDALGLEQGHLGANTAYCACASWSRPSDASSSPNSTRYCGWGTSLTTVA